MLHSLGGGTGSGLGSYILELLNDFYPETYRFSTAIFNSANDDVITSPYNSLLSIASLTDHADCVLPIENQALVDILSKSEDSKSMPQSAHSGKCFKGKLNFQERAFDGMNGLIANLLLHLTSSMRFEGPLNVDLNEITTNLVPFPRLHFLISSMAPVSNTGGYMHRCQNINQMFGEVLSRKCQLIKANPVGSTYLACAFLMRGNQCTITDLTENISRLKQQLTMAHWNPEGFKVGICHQSSINTQCSLLCLGNNTCIRKCFMALKQSFQKLYRKRVYLHHYSKYMDTRQFSASLETLDGLIEEYASYNVARSPK